MAQSLIGESGAGAIEEGNAKVSGCLQIYEILGFSRKMLNKLSISTSAVTQTLNTTNQLSINGTVKEEDNGEASNNMDPLYANLIRTRTLHQAYT